jgi:hypothetical protein
MRNAASTLSALLLTACSSAAYGPSVLVLPGSGKTFEQFRFDEQECRGYAQPSDQDSAAQQQFDRRFVQCMYAKGHKVPVSSRYSDAQQETAARTPPPPAQPPAEARAPAPPPPPGQPPAEAPPDLRTQ